MSFFHTIPRLKKKKLNFINIEYSYQEVKKAKIKRKKNTEKHCN